MTSLVHGVAPTLVQCVPRPSERLACRVRAPSTKRKDVQKAGRVCSALSEPQPEGVLSTTRLVSRRQLGGLALLGSTLSSSRPVWADAVVQVQPQTLAEARGQLLDTIARGGGELEMERAIDLLAPFNPTPNPARSPQLQGEWRLLWSSQSAEVTR
eukprot:CAMPEP_0198208126 /NCGR_PEP_ID=MMETSP1445-20131203/11526_1 /TAXON_ID=36898 /ORGANISM="Pyramimonas sp., Strain CCMP2087" /LENGTH=155 /DNA_ID=CAMNT_0043881407 /DNA_START=182 /DNA_END=646 /DNA_ORIENTATION=-